MAMHKGGVRGVPEKYQLRFGGPRTPLGRVFRAVGYQALESVILRLVEPSTALVVLSQLRRLAEGGYKKDTMSAALRRHGLGVGAGSRDLKWLSPAKGKPDLRENHK